MWPPGISRRQCALFALRKSTHLRVGHRRADGFHPLLSWMATVGLFDTLMVDDPSGVPPGRERAGAARILLLSSDLPGLPDDGSNLVVRAAEALAHAIAGSGAGDLRDDAAGPSGGARRAGAKSGSVTPQPRAATPAPGLTTRSTPGGGNAVSGVREGVGTPITAGHGLTQRDGEVVARVRPVAARLVKQIPLGAGLGGGSSDAARTLIGLNRFWDANWSADELSAVAAQLGSDVPFFLHGPSSICTGRGEVVKPVSPPRPKWAVLVLPEIHMPTAAVYRRFDEMNLGFDEFIEGPPNWEHWSTRNAKDFLAGVVNDLEAPAFEIRPDLGTLRAEIELKLTRPVRMSGSGSSLFTLFDDEREARVAAGNISEKFDNVRALAVEMAPMLNDDAA